MMAIRKLSEVMDEIFDADRMAYDRDRMDFIGRAITADRLSLVKRLRKLAPAGLATFEPFEHICSQLEAELHAASIEPERKECTCMSGGGDWEGRKFRSLVCPVHGDKPERKGDEVESSAMFVMRITEYDAKDDRDLLDAEQLIAERDAAIRAAAIRSVADELHRRCELGAFAIVREMLEKECLPPSR